MSNNEVGGKERGDGEEGKVSGVRSGGGEGRMVSATGCQGLLRGLLAPARKVLGVTKSSFWCDILWSNRSDNIIFYSICPTKSNH